MSFHVRRQDREITDPEEMRRILKTADNVTVALCMNNEPYLVSLSHGYDQTRNCIYFHCAREGKKIVYMNANDKVWGQAVVNYSLKGECNYTYACVHFSGRVTFINDPDEKRHALECMIKQLSENPDEKISKLKSEKVSETNIGRIDLNYMTCKKTRI